MGALLCRPVLALISCIIPDVIQNMMRSLLHRSVEVEISNKTRNIVLKNPTTYFDCGRCSAPLLPELSPGSPDSCRCQGSYPLWGVAGVLVYETKSFTLAIHFSNPIDYNKFSMELGLELSPGKTHLGNLVDTYVRMAHGTYSSSRLEIKFDRGIVVGKNPATVQLSHGPVKVTATMSSATDAHLIVVLEEEEGSGEEAGTEDPRRRKHVQEK